MDVAAGDGDGIVEVVVDLVGDDIVVVDDVENDRYYYYYEDVDDEHDVVVVVVVIVTVDVEIEMGPSFHVYYYYVPLNRVYNLYFVILYLIQVLFILVSMLKCRVE